MYKKIFLSGLTALCIIALGGVIGYTAISSIAGLAVAQSSTKWNNLKDAGTLTGDAQSSGIISSGLLSFNGSTWDRLRGDSTNGLNVQVKPSGTDNGTNPAIKVPTLPCVARDTSAAPTFTAGNIVPCAVSTSGATLIVQSGINFSTLGIGHMAIVQAINLFNTQTTGAADTAVVATIAAATSQRAFLYSIEAQCSTGTSTITVADGATTIFTSMGANVPAAPATYRREWWVPLTGTTNTAMTITLASCGAGNTGTLQVHASRV